MFSISSNQFPSLKQFVSSDEVEKYVGKVQSRLLTSAEKKSKGFAFGRLYYDAKDYGSAKKYLEDYLTIQDRDFRVYNLLGQCEEALDNNESALAAYKKSLDLCSSQNDIIVKVISLCMKCPMDPLRAKLWADKGARVCPNHPAVFDLKWHLLNIAEPKDFEEMELLLADELARRAREPSLHIKLVNLYTEAGSHKRAFLHCQSVQKTGAFDEDIAWLECAVAVFDSHRMSKQGWNTSASIMFALTLCKLMHLHLKSSSTRLCLPILQQFDATVKEMISRGPLDVFDGLTMKWKDSVSEMKGQLYFNVGVFLLKLAQENIISWTKAKRMCAVMMMESWGVEMSTATTKLISQDANRLGFNTSSQVLDWSMLTCTRLSHTGHLLLYFETLCDAKWLKDCALDFCTDQGQTTLLDNIYTEKVDSTRSYLKVDHTFKEIDFNMPDLNELLKLDEVAISQHAADLHQLIWTGLQWDILQEQMKPGVGVIVGRLFDGIAIDVKNINNCHHSSLCLRDLEAFVYCVIRSSKNIHLEFGTEDDGLLLPPPLICTSLVTEQQASWWQAAYGLYTGKSGTQSISKLKSVMQKGLETVRCLQNHGIDPRILVYVSIAFLEKGLLIESSRKTEYDYKDHYQSLQKRGMHYMKEALRILEIFRADKTIPMVENPLILPLSPPLDEEEMTTLLSKNNMKLAECAMLNGDLKEALKYYEEVKSLQSVYSQSQIYIRLASGVNQKSLQGEKDHSYYIKKAKEKLNVCIQNSDHSPEFKQNLIQQLREIETDTAIKPLSVIPTVKKSLNFDATDIPSAEKSIVEEPLIFSNDEVPAENSTPNALQEQLDAKESEIKSLKQALAMYKAHIDMQKQYQAVQPVMNAKPVILPQFPPAVPHRHIRSLDSTTSATVTPLVPHDMGTGTGAGGTPGGGLETPSDMWWDSFSPQPSFEKGYFAGLAEHAQHTRDEKGEGEAPTLKDSTEDDASEETKDVSSISIPTPSIVCGTGASDISTSEISTSKEHMTPTQASSPVAVPKESPKTPASPAAYEGQDIYVEPIVQLTSQNVITGEEDEVVKFVHRSKLYRFDKDAKQWKERGIGDVKILYNDKTKQYRITMRREQVFRVCCNHMITPEMKLETKVGAKAAWSWFTAADATDSEVKPEQFTIKFGTQETADEFHDVFVQCQQDLMKKEAESIAEKTAEPEPVSGPEVVLEGPAPPVLVNPFLNTNIPTPIIPPSFPAMQIPTPVFQPQPQPGFGGPPPNGPFQFHFATQQQQQANFQNSFNGFTFKPQAAGDSEEVPAMLNSATECAATPIPPPTAVAVNFATPEPAVSEVAPTGLTPSPFSGFSFSSNRNDSFVGCSPSTPMLASLVNTSATSVITPVVTPPPPSKTTIQGMTTLPVFEKGIVDASIDPSTFWSSSSPEKPFFITGSVGLDKIGHKEESGEVPDLPVPDRKVSDDFQEANYPEEDYYAYEMYDNYEYYGENGEDYYYDSANDDYDENEDDYINYDNQPSRASSSRRGSGDEDLVIDEEKPVEDRFDIQKKVPNISIVDVIDSDLVITHEKVPNFSQKLKASRLQLPTTFFLYEFAPPCSGCRGCIPDFDKTQVTTVIVEEKKELPSASEPPSVQEAPIQPAVNGLFFSSPNANGMTFASLASANSENAFSATTGVSSFTGAGAQLFAQPTAENADEDAVDNSHDPHYDAIVTLQKVTVETGEEDDEVLFKQRAKLYRFDEKWRERGIGDIKLTKSKSNDYCRVLMRRDQIHKICANHAIMPNMDLKPLHSSDSSLVWFTPSDYSEGTPPTPQQFCVKFKNKDLADDFAAKFNQCKKIMESTLKGDEKKQTEEPNSVPEDPPEPPKGGFSKFAAKAGSWECEGCYIQNNAESSKCVACDTPNPNFKGETVETSSAVTTSSFQFSFGVPAGSQASSFSFGSATSENAQPAFSFGLKQDTPAVATFPFSSKSEAPTAPAFSFGSKPVDTATSSFSFAPKVESQVTASESKPNVADEKAPSGFGKFAAKPGSWECDGCYIQNSAESSKCVACDTANPNAPEVAANDSTSSTAPSPFSFGLPAATEAPVSNFSFASQSAQPAFSFGLKQDTSASPVFSFGLKPEAENKNSSVDSNQSMPAKDEVATSQAPFSFNFNNTGAGVPATSAAVSNFSFGGASTKPAVSSAGFAFGSGPPLGAGPTLNISWGKDAEAITPEKNRGDRDAMDPMKFKADPDTWECPSCLAKNDGYREVCRQCQVQREKTPVVRLDPSQFSTPVNLQVKNSTSLPSTPPFLPSSLPPPSTPPFLPLNLNGSESPSNAATSPFAFGNSSAPKPDNERDKALMPPPTFLPAFAKTSPKQNEKKSIVKADDGPPTSSFSSWVPQGLNLTNLFSFGTTPSPSLSNASSVDDLSQTGTINVPAAFTGTSFTFQYEPPLTTPKKQDKDAAAEAEEGAPKSPSSPNEYYNEDDDGNTSIEFTPLVSITRVETSSGEEEEDCLFSARSKMFRYDGQWKERGIGDIKILQHRRTKAYRLIMRREQTHKLCANHGIISGMGIKPMQGAKKAYTWKTIADISDGEPVEQTFAARFKEEEISDEFCAVFIKCVNDEFEPAEKGGESNLPEPDSAEQTSSKVVHEVIEILDSSDEEEEEKKNVESLVDPAEVSLQYEPSIHANLKLKAKGLLLPNSFYHVPTTELCAGKDEPVVVNGDVNSPVDLTSSTEEEDAPLTLTHEKKSNTSMEQKSDKMLLPKGFYNYKEDANLTSTNIVLSDDDEEEPSMDELYAAMDFPTYHVDEKNCKIVFAELCSVFRKSTGKEDYLKLCDGKVELKEVISNGQLSILSVGEGKLYLHMDVTAKTALVTRVDSKNTYDVDGINKLFASAGVTETFTLKFKDLLSCEKFSALIEESKSEKNHQGTDNVDLATFGSRIFGSPSNGDSNGAHGLSFASLVNSEPSGFQDSRGQTFQGAGKTLFGSSTRAQDGDGDDEGDAPRDDHDVYVEPIVRLESVATTSGEEDEWVVFNQRCKLYVFDNATKKWKERGVGEMKLLQDKTTHCGRVVMRRDQVHKLCANHLLLPTSNLEPFKGKDNTVTWNAIGDVSNGPPEDLILASRFKNETILDEFNVKFQALCSKEQLKPLCDDDEGDSNASAIFGTCDPALTKSLS